MKRRDFVDDEAAQDLVEYGLLATLIAVAVVAAVTAVGGAAAGLWTSFVTGVPW